MDDLRIRAQLVAFDPAGTGSIGTVITRAEIAETAARGEFPATLLLDLDQVDTAGGGEVAAHARLAVDWDEDMLDQLLASTEANEIALWFDERELARAFDEDEVEGHGLRQRAAVLAVAVAAAGASATPALARPVEDALGSGAQPTGVSVAQQTGHQGQDSWAAGAVRGLQEDQKIGAPASTSTGDVGKQPRFLPLQPMSSGDVSALEAVGAILLISAAGFGVARKRTPPLQPA